MELPLNILFQDQHLVVVTKPARLLVASDQSGDQTLLQQVRFWNAERQAPGKKGYCVPIHFLDRPVSGVVVFALSSKAAPRLNALFKQRTLHKTYVAIVEGQPAKAQSRLEHFLVKDRSNNLVRIGNAQEPAAKLSILDYQVLATQNSRTWIKVNPETGRSHQIRVQLASMGTPIVGDGKYGAKSSWEGRIALHAFRVELKHPVGGQALTVEAGLPDYWNQIWPEPWPLAAMRDNDEK